jgi:hypothetical protein
MNISCVVQRITCFYLLLVVCFNPAWLSAQDVTPKGRAEKEEVRLTVAGDGADMVEPIVRRILGDRFEFTNTGERLTLNTSCKKLSNNVFSCKIEGSFKEIEFSVDESSAKDSPNIITVKLVREIADQIDRAYPLASRIFFCENDLAVVDMGDNVGLKIGQRLRVYSDQDKRMGLLRVESVGVDESETLILRGKNNMREGLTVVRESPFRHGMGVQYRRFPLTVNVNPSFTTLTGEESEPFPDVGSTVMVSYRRMYPLYRNGVSFSRWGFEVGSGFSDLGAFQWWEMIELNVFIFTELIPDVLALEFGGGASIPWPESYRWARPEGTYNDNIPENQGETKASFNLNYHGSGRAHIFMHPGFSLFMGGGYYRYTGPLKLEDSNKPSEEKGEGYAIDENWLEYDFEELGGLTIQAGLAMWFR